MKSPHKFSEMEFIKTLTLWILSSMNPEDETESSSASMVYLYHHAISYSAFYVLFYDGYIRVCKLLWDRNDELL